MKFKKIFPIVICSALLVGAGAAFAFNGVRSKQAGKVNADTDVGEIEIAEVRNAISNASAIYLLPTADYGLPDSWNNHYVAVGEEDGIFINGVKQNGAQLVYAGTGSAHITLYYGLPAAASEGDIIEFKGSFACTGYSFSVNYATQRFAETWVHALEDYDLISLKDANMPNFENEVINTEDPSDYGYIGYDETEYAKKYIGKKKGIFGYTNDTNSYALQFYFEVASGEKMTGDFDVRIGASGGWDTGHFLKFHFSNMWNDDGDVDIFEFDGGTQLIKHSCRSDLSNGQRLLEMGSIKVKGYTNKYYVFFKNNGVVSYGDYWDLASGQRSTKIGMYYGGTNVSISNSIEPAETKLTLSDASTANGLSFNTATDVLPSISTWGLWFTPVDTGNVTYKGVDKTTDTFNFFKKVGATTNSFYFGLGDLGLTAENGDILHIGGMFKLAKYIDNITVVYKLVVQDMDLQFDGTAWREIDPDYTAVDFAKDLLKQTLTICTGEGGNNKDALTTVWETLSGANYYGKLSNAEIADLASESGDPAIVVPTTAAEVDAMSDGNALAAGLYRYDYCVVKYSLTQFISGRTPSLASAEMRIVNNTTNMNTIIVIISSIVVAGASLFVVLHFVSRKRKQDR